jgi:hypothetical protein
MLILCVMCSFTGAVLAWCYAFLRPPMFISEATVETRGVPATRDEIESVRHKLLDKPVLAEAAGRSGSGLAGMSVDEIVRRARVEILSDNRLKLGFTCGDPKSAESFVRSWIGFFEQRGAGSSPSSKQIAGLREKLSRDEGELEKRTDDVRSFLTGHAGLSPTHADAIVSRLARGETLSHILSEERIRVARDLHEAEEQLRKLMAKERSLVGALEREEKYIVTYQLKEENPVVRDLRQQLAEKQMQLQRLKVDSTTRHPLRARLEQEVAKIEELLKDKPLESIKEQKREINPVYNDIAIELSRTRREADTLRNQTQFGRTAAETACASLARLAEEEDSPSSPLGECRARLKAVQADRALLDKAVSAAAVSFDVDLLQTVSPASPAVPVNPALRMRMLIVIGAFAGAGGAAIAWAAAPLVRKPRPPELS